MHRQKSIFCSLLTLIAFICIIGLLSCQKEIHITLASSPPQLVVEGAIETGRPPYVFLTSSLSFFSQVDLTTLENSYVHNASVQVSDGVNTINLKEYAIDTAGGNKIYIYFPDTANLPNFMLGQVGKTYKLTILNNGVSYTSSSKIPFPKGPDSLWFAPPISTRSGTPPNARQLFANYTDPDTPGNYVRYFTKRNNEAFFPSQLFSDEVVNGKLISNIALYAGYAHTDKANRDSLIYFYSGDAVTLKWCEIDKGVYHFWNTYDFAGNAIGNPFASPINIQSNVSNGALGIWAAYGSVSYTIVVP
jgi:hypothetical protein